MSDNIPREHYLSKLRALRGMPVIKVITGMRRCGKSTLMAMFRDEVLASGVRPEDVFFQDLDDRFDSSVSNFQELIDLVKVRFTPSEGKYIFLDEVQDVDGWEQAVRTFFARGADVYITGSNSRMLSSELSTLLSGRYVEIEVMPLSFTEFMDFRRTYGSGSGEDALFSEYMRWGGLPAVVRMAGLPRVSISDVISSTYDTVFIKDVIGRNVIRSPAAAENISRFLMKNIGDRTSVKVASGYLTSKGMKASPDTVDAYIHALESARLFYRTRRKDSVTKEYLMTSDKFYATDLGMRNVAVGYDDRDLDGILENLVFTELLYRYGNAFVMNVDGKEVDFVSRDANECPVYFQVTLSITEPSTKKRELAPLKALDDNYPKYVITMDRYPYDDIDGIRIVNIVDFLSEKDVRS